MNTPSTTPSSSKKTRKPAPKPKASPSAILTDAKASAVKSTPTEENASQKLAKIDPEIKASRKNATNASESKPSTDWTSQTKKFLKKNRNDLLNSLDEEDTTALMSLDHLIESIKSPFVPSERNCSLDFWYEKAKDGSRGAPVINISAKCNCEHEYAGEHHLNGRRLKKGQFLPQTLAALANKIKSEIRKNWEDDICEESEDEGPGASAKPTLKVARTKRL